MLLFAQEEMVVAGARDITTCRETVLDNLIAERSVVVRALSPWFFSIVKRLFELLKGGATSTFS